MVVQSWGLMVSCSFPVLHSQWTSPVGCCCALQSTHFHQTAPRYFKSSLTAFQISALDRIVINPGYFKCVSATSLMLVSFKPANVKVASYPRLTTKEPIDILKGSCPTQYQKSDEVLQSSFPSEGTSDMSPAKNSFVGTVLRAYSNHY